MFKKVKFIHSLELYSPNKGCTVKTISPRVMSEVYLIRCALEILAVKVYSGKMRESTIMKLEELANNMGIMLEENNLFGIVENDEEFHSTIVREAEVKTLYETWKNFEGQNAAVYYTMRNSNLMPKGLKANHYMIIEAFKENDLNKVCNIIQNHYMVVPEDLYNSKKMDKDKILNIKF